MAMLLTDYDRYTSVLGDEMPVFNIYECLQTKSETEKTFFYQLFNTQIFYSFLQVSTHSANAT